MVYSACRKVILGIDDIAVFIGGGFEIASAVFKINQCSKDDAYLGCQRLAIAGLAFAVFAMVLAIISFAMECCCTRGCCCKDNNGEEKDAVDDLLANPGGNNDIKTKDIMKILKTSFTAIALALLLGAACSKDVCEL
mgnify:CR=1 FL=1